MPAMMNAIVAFIFVIGILVFIHELGHFLMAKLFKIRVEVFSLGFGPRLFGFRRGDTDYRVSLVPLGGYVKMLGENPDEIDATAQAPDAFLARPKWQRFCVAAAGPVMNLLLAVALPMALYMTSYTVPAYLLEKARVGLVVPGSPAERAGIRPGDLIVRYDTKENPTWEEVEHITLLKPNQPVTVVVDRQGQRLEAQMVLSSFASGTEVLGESGLLPSLPFDGVEIGRIEKGRPADLAGLKPGDKIIKVNDTPTPAFEILVAIVGAHAGKEITLTYIRDGQQHQVKVVPFDDQGRGRIGFARVPPPVPMVETELGPGRALMESVRQNLFYLWVTQEALRQIFRGQRTVRETFAGPLRIAEISGEAAAHGVKELIKLMSYLSLSLGVFNLLPIPVLDGGVIFLLLIEWFFGLAGRQMSVALREKIQTVGFALILIFMGYIIYSDIAMKFSTASRKIAEPPPAEQPAR